MADRLRDEILNNVCQNRELLLVVVGFLGVFLLLSLVGTRVITPGTGAHVVNTINVVALSILFILFGILATYCYRSGRAYY